MGGNGLLVFTHAGSGFDTLFPAETLVYYGTMLSMIYKMGMSAEKSWRRLRGFRQLGKVIEGVKFNDGIEVIEDSRAVA